MTVLNVSNDYRSYQPAEELVQVEIDELAAAQNELERGIEVTEAMKACISDRMHLISKKNPQEKLHVISNGNILVFEVPEYPHLVFICRGAEKRFKALVQAKHVCMTHQLDLLVIPYARKFEIGNTHIIAEEKLDINPNPFYQEQLYHNHVNKLDPIISQLAVFIAKTGFSDVNWRNIPLLEKTLQVALFDVDETEGAKIGFFGRGGYLGCKRLGLIGCAFTEAQIDLVIQEAIAHKIKSCWGFPVWRSEMEPYKTRRLEEIALNERLEEFYAKKGITTGREPFKVDIESLGLDLDKKKQYGVKKITVVFRNALEDIINYINDSIQKSEEPNPKGIRQVNIITNTTCWSYWREKSPVYVMPFVNEEEENLWVERISPLTFFRSDGEYWIDKIINTLLDKGHIFRIVAEHGCGRLIQV